MKRLNIFKKYLPVALVLTLVLSFSACAGSSTTSEVDLTKAPSTSEIVDRCKTAFAKVVSWRERISLSPSKEVEILEWEIIATERKEHATAKMADGSRSESYIWEGHYRCDWRNEDGGYWEAKALGKLSDTDKPLQELIFEQIFGGAENLSLVGTETVQGKTCYVIQHSRSAGEYGDLHFPSHKSKVWIDMNSYLPLKETNEAEQTVITTEYYDYNAPISFEMPVGPEKGATPEKGAKATYNQPFITDRDFKNYSSMSIDDIRSFLTKWNSCLQGQIQDVDGQKFEPAQVIYEAAQKYRISPKVLLATAEKEQCAITSAQLSADRLALLMGAGTRSTARDQISYAAQLFRSYLSDLDAKGATTSGWEVGVTNLTEDGVNVTPANRAVAALFTYTPYAGAQWGGNQPQWGGNYLFYDAWHDKFHFGDISATAPYLLNVAEPMDTSNFIQSGLIWMWTIHFENLIITDISDYTLILVPFEEGKIGDEKVELIAGKVTKITKAVPVEVGGGRVTFERREIKFADLQVGDIVEVYARWQERSNMEPEATITVWDKRELGGLEKSEKAALSISWTAGITAEVEKINGRTLSLLRGGEKLDVFIREDASVRLLVRSSGSRIEVSFGQIKLGDSVSVLADFTGDKRLEGTEIDIFPRD